MMQETMDNAADANPLTSVPIEVTVSVGRAHLSVKDLLGLEQGSVVRLNRRLEDPVEIYVSGKLIAEGTLEILEDAEDTVLGVRITDVVALSGGAS